MCKINVRVPVVVDFCHYFSLWSGVLFTLYYTVARAFFYIFVMGAAVIEVLVNRDDMQSRILAETVPIVENVSSLYFLYFCYQSLMIFEAFLLISCVHLAIGIFIPNKYRPHLIYYLLCRLIVWLLEFLYLFTLTIKHVDLIGWYITMLFLIFPDVYLFVVVYSYYVQLMFDEAAQKPGIIVEAPY